MDSHNDKTTNISLGTNQMKHPSELSNFNAKFSMLLPKFYGSQSQVQLNKREGSAQLHTLIAEFTSNRKLPSWEQMHNDPLCAKQTKLVGVITAEPSMIIENKEAEVHIDSDESLVAPCKEEQETVLTDSKLSKK